MGFETILLYHRCVKVWMADAVCFNRLSHASSGFVDCSAVHCYNKHAALIFIILKRNHWFCNLIWFYPHTFSHQLVQWEFNTEHGKNSFGWSLPHLIDTNLLEPTTTHVYLCSYESEIIPWDRHQTLAPEYCSDCACPWSCLWLAGYTAMKQEKSALDEKVRPNIGTRTGDKSLLWRIH